jgi:hypothetical protein
MGVNYSPLHVERIIVMHTGDNGWGAKKKEEEEREEGAHLTQGSWLLSLVWLRTVERLMAHSSAKVMVGFLGAGRRSMRWKGRRKDWQRWFLSPMKGWVSRQGWVAFDHGVGEGCGGWTCSGERNEEETDSWKIRGGAYLLPTLDPNILLLEP